MSITDELVSESQNGQSPLARILLRERARLVQEIARIDRFLEQEGIAALSTAPAISVQNCAPRPTDNILSKVQALQKVLEVATTPLSPKEMVEAMKRLGYNFESSNPSNTLNPYLYGQRRLGFLKKFGRGFILAEREKEFEQIIGMQRNMPPESPQ